MAQWFLQWGWAAGVLIFAVMLVMFLYRSSVASWNKARGDLKTAVLLEVGPIITFSAKVGIMAVVFGWATMYIYGAANNSPLAQSFYNLGSAGVEAIGGTFRSYEIAMPEAPALADMVADNLPSLPTEGDVRNALGVPDSYADYERPNTNADKNETAAPAASNNSGLWSVDNVRSTVNQMGTTPAMGPQPQPIQGPAPAPTNTPAPVQGPVPAPTQGFITGFGGGPSAADADAAVASVGTYTVQRGDALWKISETVYGTRNKAMTICNANRTVVRDCNNLRVGMVLTIP